jgi:2-dehydropantoate 2-reductase
VLREQVVLGAIVGFNVVAKGAGAFRRATSGPLVIEAHDDARARDLATLLRACGFEVERAKDIRASQWSKLVINLNNAVSALSGAPSKDLVLVAGYRRVVRAVISEAVRVLRRANITLARVGPLPVHVFPAMLALPTPLLRVAARAQLKIDPEARSSMWQDLALRRATEVDYLNGEIVRVAASCGAKAPLNERIVALVHDVEKRGEGSPNLSPDALWRALNES